MDICHQICEGYCKFHPKENTNRICVEKECEKRGFLCSECKISHHQHK
jgi:hypothetical protein